jgi:hypothetical protein
MVLKPGDIIGYTGLEWISAAINLATGGLPFWSINHVGMLAHEKNGRLFVFQSTAYPVRPCDVTGNLVKGVQGHDLTSIDLYGGRIWHYPLYRELYEHESDRLTDWLYAHLGVPYDPKGAARSAGKLFSLIESLFRGPDLEYIFCSELLAAAYATVGLSPTDHVSRWNPNKLLRKLRRDGILLKPRRLV